MKSLTFGQKMVNFNPAKLAVGWYL